MADDPVAAALDEEWALIKAQIGHCNSCAGRFGTRLVAALDGVLGLHKPGDGTAEIHTLTEGWHRVTACICEEPWPCETYRAISAALPGEEADHG